MSFAGFVFDMIRRDKENPNFRLLRRERLNKGLDKMHKRAPHASQYNCRRHGKDNQIYPAKGTFRTETYRTNDADYYWGGALLLHPHWFSYLSANSAGKREPPKY